MSFTNPADGTVLKGTLTLPDESKRYPAVVLISGSGAQNRDECSRNLFSCGAKAYNRMDIIGTQKLQFSLKL